AQLAANLVEVLRLGALADEAIPHDAELQTFLLAMEEAGRDERLQEAVRVARGSVAVELAFDGPITVLVAQLGVGDFGADVEAFVEAEVAGVAAAVVGAFEALHAAEAHHFLPLRPANLHDVARFVVAGSDAEDIFPAVATISVRAAAAGLATAAGFAA